ncbi:MAG: HAD family hydrolase [Halobacteriaceae archaeon]
MYDAVIFDNDGVILELTDRTVFRRVVHDAFAAHGVTDPPPAHLEALQFVDHDRVAETLDPLAEAHDLDPATLWATRDELAVAAQVTAAANGEKPPYDDVHHLDDFDVPLGVVSNNQHDTVTTVLAHHGLADRFETMYGRAHSLEGLRRKKPNPHYIERAIADIGAENPLYVGDSATDVIAADNAGIDAAFIRRPHRRDYDLPVTPDHELEGLGDIHPLLNGRH